MLWSSCRIFWIIAIFPIVTAFVLGLLTAISPCPLATNITAIGYISRDIESKRRIFWNGILYTVGRIIAYSILGASLFISFMRVKICFLFKRM
jgi:cytochrome c-type biogenesis protein